MRAWIERYLLEHPERTRDFWRLVRFGVTGTVSSLVHYGVYYLALMWADVTSSYTAGYLVGLLCNYVLTTFFTFRRRPSRWNALGFAGSHLLNYLLEIGLLWLFLWLGIGKLLAPILVMTIAVPVNFLILRYVFVKRK